MTKRIDLYAILGLTKAATQEEIKKRFRKLARENHPDIVGDDSVALERFSQIRQAYEILIDPEKRAVYDKPSTPKSRRIHRKTWRPPGGNRFGTAGGKRKKAWTDPQNQFNLDDIFQQDEPIKQQRKASSTVYNRQQAKPGSNVMIHIECLSSIAKHGGTLMVEYKRKVRADDLTTREIDELHLLRIPPNTRHHERLIVEKMGNAGENGGAYGELHCTISVVDDRQDPVSQTHNSNTMQLPISIPEAVLGGRATISTPTGSVMISLPPRSSSGRRLRLKGKGQNGSDLFVELKIVLPPRLDEASVELIREFAALNPMTPRD